MKTEVKNVTAVSVRARRREVGLRDFSRSLPMALLRAREAVMTAFRPMLRRHDLTEQQWRVLRALAASPAPLRASEIARSTCLSVPSLSRLLKTLEARAVIRRTAQKTDLRAAQITLTASGRSLIARIAPVSERCYDEITKTVGATDLERLYALLETVRSRLDAVDDEGASTKDRRGASSNPTSI